MALYSKGCYAYVEEVKQVNEEKGYIVAVIYTCREHTTKNGKKRYKKDWELRVLLSNPNNEILHDGDQIIIKTFYISNIVHGKHMESCSITEWEVASRNQYKDKWYKKSKEAQDAAAQAQREQIEAEMQAQDAELDEIIENINADGVPF